MKPKYIYVLIKQNRYGVLDKIRKFHNIHTPDSTLLENTKSSLDSSTRDKTFEFNVTFSYKDWISMSPEDVLFFDKQRGSRSYCILQRKLWTDKIYAAVHKATKLPCALVFKTSKISETDIYLNLLKGYIKNATASF